ncbi:MAG: methyltransferase domain-containing protein [Bacteroidota bacterium]|nr:methyltransferase domain-containing protein [Bacteroidota bacterium]
MESTTALPQREHMPKLAFRLMKLSMNFMDLFFSPANKLNSFGIYQGDTVIDYGCGPGRYLKQASSLVGLNGRVYAVDIHDLAYKCVTRLVKRKKLSNVYPVKANRYFAAIQEDKADLIFVLDAFHMISQPNEFLNELHRLVKPNGRIILEDGHQKRSKTLKKVNDNKRWYIQSEKKKHLILSPRFKIK